MVKFYSPQRIRLYLFLSMRKFYYFNPFRKGEESCRRPLQFETAETRSAFVKQTNTIGRETTRRTKVEMIKRPSFGGEESVLCGSRLIPFKHLTSRPIIRQDGGTRKEGRRKRGEEHIHRHDFSKKGLCWNWQETAPAGWTRRPPRNYFRPLWNMSFSR